MVPDIFRNNWMDLKYHPQRSRCTSVWRRLKGLEDHSAGSLYIGTPFLWLWFCEMYPMAQANEHPNSLRTSRLSKKGIPLHQANFLDAQNWVHGRWTCRKNMHRVFSPQACLVVSGLRPLKGANLSSLFPS